MDLRSDFWHHLSLLLTGLPSRNNVIMVGDMNTSLPRCSASVGLDSYEWCDQRQGPIHSDSNVLHNLLNIHQLTALNTWHHHLGPTYNLDHQHSWIDFLICKQSWADAISRQVHYLHAFPLKSMNGASHVPLMTSLLKAWHPGPQHQQQGWTGTQRLDLYQQWLQPSPTSLQLQHAVQLAFHQLPLSNTPLDDIQMTLNSFPPVGAVPSCALSDTYSSSSFETIQELSDSFETST